MTTKPTENPLAGEASEGTKSSEAYPGEEFYRREARLKHALDEATRRREIDLKLRDTYNQGVTRGLAQGHAQGREEGIEEGKLRQQRSSILVLLTERFGSVDAAIEEALAGKTDAGELQRLLLAAATCGSLDEFKTRL
ncbi:MAG: hypothetical protein Q4G68_10975 [Planctomycetia bacterium]|nr:hypothetical protein [Planctomycetia bacterium]